METTENEELVHVFHTILLSTTLNNKNNTMELFYINTHTRKSTRYQLLYRGVPIYLTFNDV